MYLKPHCFLVTNAAAATRLTTSDTKVPAVVITAEISNAGRVYIGDNQVSASNYGADLGPGDHVKMSAEELGWANANISLKDIWHFSGSTGDGVAVLYLERAE